MKHKYEAKAQISMDFDKFLSMFRPSTNSRQTATDTASDHDLKKLDADMNAEGQYIREEISDEAVRNFDKKSFLSDLSDDQPGRILIAEDDRITRLLLVNMLKKHSHHVIWATNGKEALDKATSNPIDVIILDVMMPILDGFTVCAKLRENNATALLPILLNTALVDREFRIKGMQSGASDYLTKPIDPLDLTFRLKNALRYKRICDKALEDYVRLKLLNKI